MRIAWVLALGLLVGCGSDVETSGGDETEAEPSCPSEDAVGAPCQPEPDADGSWTCPPCS